MTRDSSLELHGEGIGLRDIQVSRLRGDAFAPRCAMLLCAVTVLYVLTALGPLSVAVAQYPPTIVGTGQSISEEVDGIISGKNRPIEVRKAGDAWSSLADVLTPFLVLAILLEVALTPLFNWRLFAERFEGRGIKTPVAFGVAFCLTIALGIDIVADIMTALYSRSDATGPAFTGNIVSKVVTAFVIAGGSDGVFRIFSRLGIRSPAERQLKADERRHEALEIVSIPKTNTLEEIASTLLGVGVSLSGVTFTVIDAWSDGTQINVRLEVDATPDAEITEAMVCQALLMRSGAESVGLQRQSFRIANFAHLESQWSAASV
ncbi:MAG: hypothetical protein AAF662_04945 [Pseudomonadota bacterium]